MMVEAYIGEIRIFAGTFAPSGWHMCDGTVLQINQNQALFAVIGITYGGNGSTTFALPDLRGRFPIDAGHRTNSVFTYNLGSSDLNSANMERIALAEAQMPAHIHAAVSPAHCHNMTVPQHTHGFKAPVHAHGFAPVCSNSSGSNSPVGAYFGETSSEALYTTQGGSKMGAATTDNSDANLGGTTDPSGAVTAPSSTTAATVSVGQAGQSSPIDIRPPFLAVNYIIAVEGLFPDRP